MNNYRFALASLLAMIVAISLTETASAQYFGRFGGPGFGGPGFGYGYRSFVHPNHAAPPYFALNPPVYYGKVRPRDYGWSPFPYGPNGPRVSAAARPVAVATTPQSIPVRGELIINPYALPEDSHSDNRPDLPAPMEEPVNDVDEAKGEAKEEAAEPAEAVEAEESAVQTTIYKGRRVILNPYAFEPNLAKK